MLEVFVASIIAGVIGTGIGGILSLVLKNKNVDIGLLYGFTSGVMLLLVFDLISEACKESEIFFVICFFVVGYLLIYMVEMLVDAKGNKNKIFALTSSTKISKFSAIIIVLSIALHNFPEGMIIGATSYSGLSLEYMIMVALHNIPEGLALSLPLLQNKVKPLRVLLICLLSGLPTVIGAVIGYNASVNAILTSMCLSLAAGCMAYVVFNEMLAVCYEEKQKNVPFSIIVGIILGLIVIFSL